MINTVRRGLLFVRARWRWVRGCCPRCNRNIYAAFRYVMTNDPNCPVCKNHIEADGNMWNRYQAQAPSANRNGATATVQDGSCPRGK